MFTKNCKQYHKSAEQRVEERNDNYISYPATGCVSAYFFPLLDFLFITLYMRSISTDKMLA